MGLFTTVLKQLLKENKVVYKRHLSESAYHIRIQSESIKNLDFIPGNFLRVAIGINDNQLSKQDAVRSYSIWDINQVDGTADLAIATNSNGAGANWAKQIRVGDSVFVQLIKGKFTIDHSADSYLLIGDLSALSHLYMIYRNLSKHKQKESIIYSENCDDFYSDIDCSSPLEYYEMPENPIEEIILQLAVILPKMTENKMVYIAGDSRVCVALNTYFRHELGWSTNQIKTKPFWNPNKKGLE